ncbi:MAG: FAD-binding protein [Clostridiales bacterium]|nr:FAD-binding protein [Clostridiales bacterium]
MIEKKQADYLRINGLKLSLEEEPLEKELLKQRAARVLNVAEDQIWYLDIHKKSLDARKQAKPFFFYSIDVKIRGQRLDNRQAEEPPTKSGCKDYTTSPSSGARLLLPPLVVGAGPAGLFAALALAEAGYKPLLIEQGQPVQQRYHDVKTFWQSGKLDQYSNVQFGEGGAGTFSDGKLTYRGKDPLARQVLQTLVELGASPEILYWHKPHIGSDKLRELLPLLRNRIIAAGGCIKFSTHVSDIMLCRHGGSWAIEGLKVGGAYSGELMAQAVIFAPGNGARATMRMLSERGLALCAKPFAIGLRIEHDQSLIDIAQYGSYAGHPALPPADYMLKYRTADNRGFYSFCMCPGGQIVNAASETGALVTNGISLAARVSGRANSALVGEVRPVLDFEDDPIAALTWQQKVEQAAYAAGGRNYALPVCLVEDFLYGASPQRPPPEFLPLSVGTQAADLRSLLPEALAEGLAAALKYWNGKIKGFANQAVLAALESRTSSPVRILRGSDGQSINVAGFYPAGEGAGYAGGILSSACDGLRAAAALCEHYAPLKGNVEYRI